jgi:cation:H+ antiporter
MIVVGFGTSAPEMVVSAMAAMDGNPGLALGNALGSNIVNVGLVLGLAGLIAPMAVHSNIIRKELPLLLIISTIAGGLLLDSTLSRVEGIALLIAFFALISWSIFSSKKGKGDALETEIEAELEIHKMPLKRGLFWIVFGLALLVGSSRLLVWGAVAIAQSFGISDLIIGLTVVAVGTSLPELAASIIAARKNEHDIAIGNIVGSNMFNLLAVVGIAATISPMEELAKEVITRDWPTMMLLSGLLYLMAKGFRRKGHIDRLDAAILLAIFIGYNFILIQSVLAT